MTPTASTIFARYGEVTPLICLVERVRHPAQQKCRAQPHSGPSKHGHVNDVVCLVVDDARRLVGSSRRPSWSCSAVQIDIPLHDAAVIADPRSDLAAPATSFRLAVFLGERSPDLRLT